MLDYDVIYEKKARKNATYGTYRRGTLGYDKDGPDLISRREAGGLEEYRLVVRKLKSLGLSTEGKLPTLKRRLAAAVKRRNPGHARKKTSMVSRREAGGLEEYRLVVRHLKSLGLSTKGKLPTLQRRLDAAMARGEYSIIDEREFMSRGKKVKAVSRLVSRRNPGRKRKMAPAVKSRAALVKKAFALREKTGSRMKPTTIMKDPAAAIRRLSR